MLHANLRRQLYHVRNFAGVGMIVTAFLSGPATYSVLYALGIIRGYEVGIAAISALLGVTLLYLVTFLYYWLKRKTLPDPPRQLAIEHQQRIAKYLQPYSPNRIVRLHYYPGVLDAADLGRSIQIVLQGLGWGCDIESAGGLWEPSSHSKGLWVYGEGRGDPQPPTCDLIQDAFRKVKLRVHYDPNPHEEQSNVIVIGFWE